MTKTTSMKELLKSYKWLIAVILLGILCTMIHSAIFDRNNDSKVNITLPDGYRGPVIVILDQEKGETFKNSSYEVNLDIPESGILYTQFPTGPEGNRLHFFYRTQDGLETIYEHSEHEGKSNAYIPVACISTGLHGRIDLNSQNSENGYNIFSFVVKDDQGIFDCEDVYPLIEKELQN